MLKWRNWRQESGQLTWLVWITFAVKTQLRIITEQRLSRFPPGPLPYPQGLRKDLRVQRGPAQCLDKALPQGVPAVNQSPLFLTWAGRRSRELQTRPCPPLIGVGSPQDPSPASRKFWDPSSCPRAH